MGVSGRYVKSFSEANLATCTGINLNADYPHVLFDVVSVNGGNVCLKSHWDGSIHDMAISENNGQQFTTIKQKSTFERMFNKPEAIFKIMPMDGKRF